MLIIWYLFIIQKYFIVSENNDFICQRNTPLLVINSENNECVYEPYNEIIHKISNEIIKIQWLNRMNPLGVIKTRYMIYEISSKGDLIIESFDFEGGKNLPGRYYYGIKANGRPLFYDKENNNFINQINLQSNSPKVKYEAIMIKIKLTNEDDKDYYLSSTFDINAIEIFDIYNRKVYGTSQQKLFKYSSWATKIYSILDLKNEDKTYLFCYIGNKNDNNYYLSLEKFKFNNVDISKDNSFTKITSSPQNEKFLVQSSLTLNSF